MMFPTRLEHMYLCMQKSDVRRWGIPTFCSLKNLKITLLSRQLIAPDVIKTLVYCPMVSAEVPPSRSIPSFSAVVEVEASYLDHPS